MLLSLGIESKRSIMTDTLEVFSSIANRVGNSEVFYRGFDSGIMRINVFESGVKHVFYMKQDSEILIGGEYWVCLDFFPPEDENALVPAGRLMARFVRKVR